MMEEKKSQEIDNEALNTLLADAALEVVRIAQDWECEAGATQENPVLEVAAAILRQNRAIQQRHYQNMRADAVSGLGNFALPPAVRKFFHDDLEGADDVR